MSEQLSLAITEYGYWAIIGMVFLQEVGFPNPIPNEVLLLFTGYLVQAGKLKLLYVVAAAIIGDLMAATLLFEVFYFFGNSLINAKPAWLPLPWQKIAGMSNSLANKGHFTAFIGRLMPFVKGYVSVISGLLRVPQKTFIPIIVSTSIIWSLAYVLSGFFVGSAVALFIESTY